MPSRRVNPAVLRSCADPASLINCLKNALSREAMNFIGKHCSPPQQLKRAQGKICIAITPQ
jgi:hypothetical protein